MKYTIKEITTNSIFSRLYLPDKRGEMPLLIFSHGIGATNKNFEHFATYFAPLGYACLCLDFKGGGKESKSLGKTTEMSVFSEVEDLDEVLKNALSFPFVDRKNVFLIGESQGGFVSAICASRNPDLIKGLFLIFPAFVIPDHARETFKNKDEIPEIIEFKGWLTLGKKYYTDVYDYNAYSEISAFKNRVLIVHGKEDKLVPFEYSVRANEVFENSELFLIDNAGHSLFGEIKEPSINLLKTFLEEETDNN